MDLSTAKSLKVQDRVAGYLGPMELVLVQYISRQRGSGDDVMNVCLA